MTQTVGFVVAAAVSLSVAWVMVNRIERVGALLGLSEAMLGLTAALVADAPEITTAVTALSRHQAAVGAGVVLGSCVFNLAAMLGLSVVAAGRINLHRRVILLGGPVAVWIAVGAVVAVRQTVIPGVALLTAGGGLAAYVGALLVGHRVPWLRAAVAEEELELVEAIHPRRGRSADAMVAAAALVIVVLASIEMERAATSIGQRHRVPDLVVGALVLAVVTSVPNAVASTYLARRGRGAAALSTALNSNNFNIVVGLLLPATVGGIGHPSGAVNLVAVWCAALTVATLVMAYAGRGLRGPAGLAIVAAYVAFVAAVVASS